jgi:hypothetical protein
MLTLQQKLDESCNCFVSPPCSWCESLSPEEAEIYFWEGLKALKDYIAEEIEEQEMDGMDARFGRCV